jgi:hypothetical protein
MKTFTITLQWEGKARLADARAPRVRAFGVEHERCPAARRILRSLFASGRSPVRQQPIRYPSLAKIALIATDPPQPNYASQARQEATNGGLSLSGGNVAFVGRKCSRLGLSFLLDAHSGFCVLGGFRPHE